MNKTKKLINSILEHSIHKDDFVIAKQEWVFKYIQYVPRNGVCPCGQKHIKKMVVIQNKITNAYLSIGNVCAATTLNIVTRDTDFKRLYALYIIKKRIGRLATDYELVINYKNGKINKWELLFYLRCVKIQWSISEKQFTIIEQITAKLIPYTEHTDFQIYRILTTTTNRIGIFSKDQENRYRQRLIEWDDITVDICYPESEINLQELSMYFNKTI